MERKCDEMKIPLKMRLKLLRQEVYGLVGYRNNVRLRLSDGSDGLTIHFENRSHAIPDVLRWKLYRWGWAKRMNELRQAYGVGTHFDVRGGVVLDIGANTGDFALSVAHEAAKVFCFEPDPKAAASLRRNVASQSNVTIVPKVVWKADELVSFGLETERADSSVFSQAKNRVEVPGITIASFIRETNLDRVALVKCDAEGAEPEVLEGVLGVAERIAGFAFDTGAERLGQSTNEACEKLLRDYGYEAFTTVAGGRQMTYGVRKRS